MFLHIALIQHGLALRKVEEFEKAIMKYIQQSITYKPVSFGCLFSELLQNIYSEFSL